MQLDCSTRCGAIVLEQALASSIPPCAIRFTFGSSGMLAEQIALGADYDVFLVANEQFVGTYWYKTKAVSGDSKVVCKGQDWSVYP